MANANVASRSFDIGWWLWACIGFVAILMMITVAFLRKMRERCLGYGSESLRSDEVRSMDTFEEMNTLFGQVDELSNLAMTITAYE
jgi:hypothetical protein